MKLLVTGGAGYIGGVISALLRDAGHQVVILDDLSTGRRDTLPRGVQLVTARVHDASGVLDDSYDAVLHLAAYIAAGESVAKPEAYWDNNAVGTFQLLDAMRSAGVRRIVFSSTANVYGDPAELPIPETARTTPPNPYAASKLAAEHALAADAMGHGLAAVSLRYFNAAGAYGPHGERHDPETHLIPTALQVAAGKRPSLRLYGDDYPTPDGTCVRDYIHVADLATAHLLALEAMRPGEHRVYNLGNGSGFSNREVIEVVRETTGHPIPVVVAPRRPGDPAELVASSGKARAELGWTPARPDLHDIVGDAWAFHREHHR
ncbi:MAG: UDP-glucose 4-epimerase GalE [Micromonosporaceae bacterium]